MAVVQGCTGECALTDECLGALGRYQVTTLQDIDLGKMDLCGYAAAVVKRDGYHIRYLGRPLFLTGEGVTLYG